MRRITVVLDRAKLDRAKAIVGGRTNSEVMDKVFDEVIAVHERARAVERLLRLEGTDRKDQSKARGARRLTKRTAV